VRNAKTLGTYHLVDIFHKTVIFVRNANQTKGRTPVYKYVITFDDGKHQTGTIPTLAYLDAELWALEWRSRKEGKTRIANIDCWRAENESKLFRSQQGEAKIQ
jgi:hypothetical protein